MPSASRVHLRDSLTSRSQLLWGANAVLLVASLILLLRPYRGIWHDSILYMGQALAVIDPIPFSHDIFFSHGSQASYTLFPRVLAWLIAHADASEIFLWLTLLGLSAFVLASVALVRRLLPEGSRLPALIALALFPSFYGASGILSYGEPFLTARTFAEPLVLAGIAAWISERRALALVSLAAAISLHPLQALPVVAAGWCWLLQTDRRWAHVSWLLPLAGLAFVLWPQAPVFARLDPAWYSQVLLRNPITLYFTSGPSNWYNLLADAFVVAVAAGSCSGRTRRCLLAVLGATALLAGAQLILVDGLRLAWFTALQPWRIHWLIHWFAVALLPWTCVQLWRKRAEEGSPRLMLFVASVLLGSSPSTAHPLTPGAILLYALWPHVARRLGRVSQHAIAGAVICIACIHFSQQLQLPVRIDALLHYEKTPGDLLQWLVAAVTIGLALPALLWRKLPGPLRITCLLLTAIACVHAGMHWDRRTDLQRLFTHVRSQEPPFAGLLRDSDQILWIGAGPLPAWSLLHRAHYMDQVQMAGLVFNRATAIEGMLRKDRLHVTDGRGQDCRIVVYPDEPFSACVPDETAVRHACQRTLGELTHVVLSYPLRIAARGEWAPPSSPARYYLYACRDLAVLRSDPTPTR